jgi:D-arabinose 1-dehydrogenase-like Zn-dependent alcohol dehydrogenase
MPKISGVVDEVGPGVIAWKKGRRVGGGGHGGHDFTCLQCRRGDFIHCADEKITGEYMLAPWEAVASMPESLDLDEAAPLLCAGITTFNSLRHSGAQPGDLLAVVGTGGLGHLGIQFANKFGLSSCCHQPRQRRRGARQKTRCACRYRQFRDRCRRRTSRSEAAPK